MPDLISVNGTLFTLKFKKLDNQFSKINKTKKLFLLISISNEYL